MSDIGGPLPKFDSNAKLQQASISALNALLGPHSSMLLRDERVLDYGVDASLEVVLNAQVTNCRSQVQIKSEQNSDPNRDGSLSLSIPVANLNYLLNGTSPLYLLYVVATKTFWFAWAADEAGRLDREKPSWRSQDSVSLRFTAKLDSAALPEIHERILRESRFHREVSETVSRYALSEQVRLEVTPGTLKTRDSTKAYEILSNSGLAMVSNGYAAEVLDLGSLLSEPRSDARIKLVLGYANFFFGKYLHAAACLGEARIGAKALSDPDLEILAALEGAVACQLGKISRHEYIRRQIELGHTSGGQLRVERQIDSLRFQHLGEREPGRRAEMLSELRRVVDQMVSDRNISEAFKMQSRLHLAYGEGSECGTRISHDVAMLRVRLDMGQSWALPSLGELRAALNEFSAWDSSICRIISEAHTLGIPVLYAEALRTRVVVKVGVLASRRHAHRRFQLGSAPTKSEIEDLKKQANDAASVFRKAGHTAGELDAKMAIADLCEIDGDAAGATSVASEVLPIAQALSLGEVESHAAAVLEGRSLLRQTEERTQSSAHEDPDVVMAQMTPEQLDGCAASALEAGRLPASRLPVVRRDVEALHQIAVERLQWCRHLEQIQNLFHTRFANTAYAADPERFCRCAKHRYESVTGSSDSRQVIDRFKAAFCSGCADRIPKSG